MSVLVLRHNHRVNDVNHAVGSRDVGLDDTGLHEFVPPVSGGESSRNCALRRALTDQSSPCALVNAG